MISRIWHSWNHPHNADACERLLRSELGRKAERRDLGIRGLDLGFEISGSGSEVPLGG